MKRTYPSGVLRENSSKQRLAGWKILRQEQVWWVFKGRNGVTKVLKRLVGNEAGCYLEPKSNAVEMTE